MNSSVFLGVDVGTSKIAAVIADRQGIVHALVSADHRAQAPSRAGRAEQDAERLRASVLRTVQGLPSELRRRVQAVGVTGQMHGVMTLDELGSPRTHTRMALT